MHTYLYDLKVVEERLGAGSCINMDDGGRRDGRESESQKSRETAGSSDRMSRGVRTRDCSIWMSSIGE